MDLQLMNLKSTRMHGQKELLTVLFRYKVRILTVFLAVVITVFALSLLSEKVFEAKATLLVKIGREYMNRSEIGDNRTIMSLNQEGVINSEIQILTNRDLIRKVIETIKPETLYPGLSKVKNSGVASLERAIAIFEKNLKVVEVKKSSVIQISFKHGDPQLAARAVTLLVDYHREQHLQVFSDPQSLFMEKQLVAYSRKLNETERNLDSFKQNNRVYSLAEQRTLLLQQRSGLDTNLKNTENTISELQKKITFLRDQLQVVSESEGFYTQTERDNIIVEAKARLLSLQLNEQELLKKYTENSQLVINARKDIALVKNFLLEQEQEVSSKVRTSNPVYMDIKRDLVRAQAEAGAMISKAGVIRSQLSAVDGEIKSLDLSEMKLESLKREKIINEKNYQTYAERSEEARISDEMNRLKLSNISVIQAASVPIEPILPKTRANMLLGIFLGAVAGIGIGFISEYLTQDFSTPEKIEKLLGIPVLVSIPYKEG